MHHAGAGAHHLNIACLCAALIAHIVAMGNRSFADIGDDFHVLMAVHRKSGFGFDLVIIPYPDRAKAHAGGVPIFAEGKMMAGLQPLVVNMGQVVE